MGIFLPKLKKFPSRGTESYDFVPPSCFYRECKGLESDYGLIGKGEDNAGVKRPSIIKYIRNIIASQEL